MKRSDIKVGTTYAVGRSTKGLWPGNFYLQQALVTDLGEGSEVRVKYDHYNGISRSTSQPVPLGRVVCTWEEHLAAKANADAANKKARTQYEALNEQIIAQRNEAIDYLMDTLEADVLPRFATEPVVMYHQGVDKMDVRDLAKIVKAAFAAGQASVPTWLEN
jgi:hypothetical protein